MAIAKAKEKMRRKKPKLIEKQQKELHMVHETGDHAVSDLAEIFSVSRATVYRTFSEARGLATVFTPPVPPDVVNFIYSVGFIAKHTIHKQSLCETISGSR